MIQRKYNMLGQSEGAGTAPRDTASFDRYPYMKHSTANPDEMLPAKRKKLTFHQWYEKNWDWNRPIYYEDLQDLWDAAQENV